MRTGCFVIMESTPRCGAGGFSVAASLRWASARDGGITREEIAVLIAFSVTPLGVGEAVGEVVAEAIRVVRAAEPDRRHVHHRRGRLGRDSINYFLGKPAIRSAATASEQQKAVEQVAAAGWSCRCPSR
jgi:uncharacterized protein YoaH (UPF0181 family)